MADPSYLRIRVALAGLLGLLVAGCASVLPQAGQDDPSAPILFTAEVVDLGGAPVPGARFQLQVFDEADAVLGQSEPPVIDDVYTATGDGTFMVHYEPTPGLRTIARANGGLVYFTVFVMALERDLVFPFGMTRELGSDAWAGEPLVVAISPHPEYWFETDVLMRAPQPPET